MRKKCKIPQMQERKGIEPEIDDIEIDGVRLLTYECLNELGVPVLGVCVPYDSTPETIAMAISQAADDLLESGFENVPREQILIAAEFIREQAKKVPGLRNRQE
jgi:hypothetical protein